MSHSHTIDQLQEALRCLPGVGPKTAQRMTFHLLERDQDGARVIAEALQRALKTVIRCKRCNNFSETELCDICASAKRDPETVCIVETPADLEAVEQTGAYQGMYFVLMGRLSPLDGVGPDDLGFGRLKGLIESEQINELIIATNLTTEGEATADYLHELLQDCSVNITRLARGVPVGGELEYIDHGTLTRAFTDRRPW
ncbi:MAG: Recombination protein RecR [Gammaproteobacteria bacterium]|nr:Recombination protein RecR [Gammaproteobacteria bacterium]